MSIHTARKKAGLTQADIAKVCGVTTIAVSNWERGIALPRAAQLPVIARLCNCTVDELLKEDK